MEQLLIILVALTVAAGGWAILALASRMGGAEKRKLSQRLTGEGHSPAEIQAARSVTLRTQSTGLPESLSRRPAVQNLQRWLNQAFPHVPLAKFLKIQALTCGVPMLLVGLVSGDSVEAFIAGVVGAVLPVFVVNSRRSKRRRQIDTQLPEALDFLSRVLRSGQSFGMAIQMMSDELAEPLAGEFRRCYDQHSLGQSIEDGLREMSARLQSADFSFFATAAIIQRQSGGDLAEVLHNISDMIRKRLRLAQGVKSKTSEGRFTGYIMVAFPAVMFVITYFMDPKRGDVMLHTSAGHTLMGIAIGLQVFGLYMIQRITTVKV